MLSSVPRAQEESPATRIGRRPRAHGTKPPRPSARRPASTGDHGRGVYGTRCRYFPDLAAQLVGATRYEPRRRRERRPPAQGIRRYTLRPLSFGYTDSTPSSIPIGLHEPTYPPFRKELADRPCTSHRACASCGSGESDLLAPCRRRIWWGGNDAVWPRSKREAKGAFRPAGHDLSAGKGCSSPDRQRRMDVATKRNCRPACSSINCSGVCCCRWSITFLRLRHCSGSLPRAEREFGFD